MDVRTHRRGMVDSCSRNALSWGNEPNIDWFSLYSPDYVISTVTASKTFTLPAAIRKLSNQEGDVVRISHTDGVAFTDYDVIDSDRVKDFANGQPTFQNNYVSLNGRQLLFNRAFVAADPQFGGTIKGPAYLYPATIAADADTIPVDMPNWLVYATAAEYVSTDVTRQNLVPRLETKANEVMQVMKDNNGGQNTRIYQPFRPFAENFVDEAWIN